MPLPIANIGQEALGLFETYEGLRGLNKLSSIPYPQFTVSPELQKSYGRAEEMSSKGYTPEEAAAFKGSMAGLNAQRFQRATDIAGGGLSQAIQGAVNYGNIKSLLGYAADDASLHRRNIQYADSIARQIQSQKNLITQGNIAHRNQMEQAFGGGLRKGLENIVNPLNLTQALDYYKTNPTVSNPFTVRPKTTTIPQEVNLDPNLSGEYNWNFSGMGGNYSPYFNPEQIQVQ